MTLTFASTNPHKVQEIQELLAAFGVQVRTASQAGTPLPSPLEDADSFEGNARIKATAYAAAVGVPCLADDSGLEVVALNGAPGVYSARYAGHPGTRTERDQANREKLLAELAARGQVERTAYLVCALCLADAQGRVLFEARGAVETSVTTTARGSNGIGYDSVLLVPQLGRTIAELSAREWNLDSHRARAVRALGEWLQTHPL